MRMGAPALLLVWAILPLLAVLMGLGMARQRALLSRLGRRSTVRRLARTASVQRRAAKATLLLAALFFLILALARPQWGQVVEPVTRRGVDVVLALDVSESMRAQDVTPDRFTRTKALAGELVRRLEGNRLGLVAFAGSGFIQCPLTLDHSAVRLFLDILAVGDVPDPGSNLEEAIRVGLTAFPKENGGRRVLVLLTDGEDLDGRAAAAATAAAEAGVVLYAVGMGTTTGGPIPIDATSARSGGYKKDRAGRIITTRLDPKHLEELVRAGGGRYLMAGAALGEAELLAAEIDRMEKSDLSSRMVTTHKERYQLPLLAAVCILVAEMLVSPARRAGEEP
jgi:Ca-activated chloride channel family protein